MNIVILNTMNVSLENDLDFSIFENLGNVTYYRTTKDEEIAQKIKDADAVIVNKSLMNEDTIKDAKKLKYIGLFATGYNNIDIDYTNKRGITVTNAGEYSTEAVVQHTFALILEIYNKVAAYDEYVKNGGWIKAETFSPYTFMRELSGKTIGVIGYGSIGRRVSDVARAFGMKVLYYKRSGKDLKSPDEFAEIDDILKNADIVSMHCPLNKDSQNMCDEAFFSKMKEDAIFINTARGPLVDEAALKKALDSGKIAYAGVDVIGEEPMRADCLLKDAKNILITPHVAWGPIETRARVIDIAYTNLKNWTMGNPTNVVSS